jgi:lysophospholipase L1-like esterase
MKQLIPSLLLGSLLSLSFTSSYSQEVKPTVLQESEKTMHSQWSGKKVVFLGDSMTDQCRVGTTCIYWEYLSKLMNFTPLVYGVNGAEWNGIYVQAQKLLSDKKNVDAILIFAGTNDYNDNIPLGKFFNFTQQKVNHNGMVILRKHREPIMSDTTFCGRVNKVLSFLKTNFPTKQVILLTPIHRAYAWFGNNNVQPDENYCNGRNLFIDSYINVLKKASSYWSVPLIDLYSLSGLYPLYDSNMVYFHDAKSDRLHPNASGDYRIAKTLQYQLLALPASF